jgi:hypothetical protein
LTAIKSVRTLSVNGFDRHRIRAARVGDVDPDLEGPATMSRIQIALNVTDIDTAVDFYTAMSGHGR